MLALIILLIFLKKESNVCNLWDQNEMEKNKSNKPKP